MRRAFVIGAVVAAAGVVAGGAMYGPDLWAGQRFQAAFDRHFASTQADTGAWPPLQDTCGLCHGPKGQPRNAQYPALAGQPAPYLEAQLHAFAEGRRPSPQMGPLAGNLTEAQIKQLAAYYARQTPHPNEPVAADALLRQQGLAIVGAKSCASCHGEGLTGGPLAPRLAGQGETYLADQLAAFKSGARRDPTQAMEAMAAGMSETEIRAAANYIAGLSARPDPAAAS
jgi:cytochrome c553